MCIVYGDSKNLFTSTYLFYHKCGWMDGWMDGGMWRCIAHIFSHSASLQADKNKQSTLPVQIELSAITSQSTSRHVHMYVVEMLTGVTISLGRKNTRLMHKHTDS